MLTQFSRTELLFGKEAMDKLAGSKVAVFGIGGVGGYVCEALVRSGVGAFDLIDDDKVCLTNLNRQIFVFAAELSHDFFIFSLNLGLLQGGIPLLFHDIVLHCLIFLIVNVIALLFYKLSMFIHIKCIF